MLTLRFLVPVGVVIVADGLHFYIPKGYIYFSMAFSLSVEALNIKARKKRISKT
jgi:predicted tellurium resistance membrane protein TerC